MLSQELYVGLSPYTGPAVFSLLAGTELTDGVWYPRVRCRGVGWAAVNAGWCTLQNSGERTEDLCRRRS